MSTGAFSLDQLMELAGLAVSQAGELPNNATTSNTRRWGFLYHFASDGLDQSATIFGLLTSPVYRLQPLENGRRVLVACGPGNNGTPLSLTCRCQQLSSFRR
jgi:NAD(P)H-hydrate epimerase